MLKSGTHSASCYASSCTKSTAMHYINTLQGVILGNLQYRPSIDSCPKY